MLNSKKHPQQHSQLRAMGVVGPKKKKPRQNAEAL
jgi:hypothetical protein